MAPIDPWTLVQAHPALAVALLFLLDGLGVPLMPEVGVLLAFKIDPTAGWGIALLGVVVAMELLASLLLYGMVRYIGLPGRMERFLAGYSRTLLVSDERLLLLNRVVPVLPMSGAFIHIRQWPPVRSFVYIAVGSFAKYGLLLLAAGSAYNYFQSGTAFAVGLVLAGGFLAVSWGFALRRWWVGRQADEAVQA